MDEQRLAARIRALDAAARWSTSNMPAVLVAATAFEEWIMRPVPIDTTSLNAHHTETTADRLGYPRCPTTWRERPDGPGHACMHLPHHHDSLQHTCSCGARFTPMARPD